MFQVTPDQEKTILIGDMLSDGLLIVELPASPTSTPADPHPSILLCPESGEGCVQAESSAADSQSQADLKRNAFGINRNVSYGNLFRS
jgi:hypothetical protein